MKKKFIDIEEQKDIMISLLKVFHNFCEENRIKYSLAYGTMLGAVRHAGFIPWDDDIDVWLMREDYDFFTKNFNKMNKIDKSIKCIDPHHNFMYYGSFAKLVDTRTVLKEKVTIPSKLGVYIDIFPLDKLPLDMNVLTKKTNECIKLHSILKIQKWEKISFKNNIIFNLKVLFTHLIPPCFFAKKVDDLLKFNYLPSNKYVHFLNYARFHSSFKVSNEVTLTKFEKNNFYIFSNYDHILNQIYGNYMMLPPLEKRVSNHSYSVYWKRSFK